MVLYLDASALQEILANVSPVVFHCVLVDELFAHYQSFLLKTGRIFSVLQNDIKLVLSVFTPNNCFICIAI